MQFIDLKAQYKKLQGSIDRRIQEVLMHGQYIMGPEVLALEKSLADYVSVKEVIAVGSGTDALLMALLALDIKPGDEVITTPFSFFATAEMIALLGAKPVFVDIEADTYAIDANLIEQSITERSKAIMVVNLYGQCADFDAISDIAQRHGLAVIEDAAQSFGACYHGRYSCSLADIACTSFYPAKPFGGYGDSGACFTDDEKLAIRLRQIRDHGQDRRYHHVLLGINGRMDSIQAAVLLEKFKLFPEEIVAREKVAATYKQLLQGFVQPPYIAPYNTSVYAQYTIEVDQRESVRAQLSEAGIPTAVHYPVPMHLQPALAYLNYKQGDFPMSEKAARRVLSLPMHPYLASVEQEKIRDILATILK